MVDTDTSPPLDRHLFLLSIDDDLETMGRWGSKVPNSLVKITIQLFLGLCPKIGVAVDGWGSRVPNKYMEFCPKNCSFFQKNKMLLTA